MSHPLPTPSQLGRVAACPQSEALEHAGSTGAYAARGTAIHAYLAACLEKGVNAALAEVGEQDRAAFEFLDVERLPAFDPAAYAAEVAIAYNPSTGEAREIGRNISRGEARARCQPGEFAGILDVLGLTSDSVLAHDYKSGYSHVDRAEVNWQWRTYSLLAARAFGKNAAQGAIIRAREDGSVWYDWATMDSLDLDAHEADLRALLAQRERILAGTEKVELNEGEHCRYCPALHACPAKITLLRTTFFNDGSRLQQDVVGGLTEERAKKAWRKIESAEKLLERLKSVVKDFARSHPVDMGDGYVLAEHEVQTEKIVPDRARPVLTALYGEQLAAGVMGDATKTEVKITKSDFRAALRKHVLPTKPKAEAKITWVERDALEALAAGRALSVSSHRRVEEFRRPEGDDSGQPALAETTPPAQPQLAPGSEAAVTQEEATNA